MSHQLLAAVALSDGQGWRQMGELAIALLLSALIGLEREIRQKSAGLRTHTLVGVGAALFMLISKYGFNDVVRPDLIILDPSRMAAQIVSGVGFLGAGLIFMRRDSIRGLTAAAAIWLTAAVGAASGAGLLLLAAAVCAVYFIVTLAFPPLVRHLPRSATAISVLTVRYPDGRGALRTILRVVTDRGFVIGEISTEADRTGAQAGGPMATLATRRLVAVRLQIQGKGSVSDLVASLSDVPDVDVVIADDANVVDG